MNKNPIAENQNPKSESRRRSKAPIVKFGPSPLGLWISCFLRISDVGFRISPLVLGIALSGLPINARAADPVMSTQRLMSLKGEWDRLVNSPLRVEGRVATSTRTQLRLVKCDLVFHMTEDVGRQLGAARNVELQGRLVRESETGRLSFVVNRLAVLPTDADQLQTREAALKNPGASDWYELSRWADERAEFYDDESLRAAALLCATRGLALEVRDLAKDDVEGRFRLAAQARELRLPDTVADELRHEAFRVWWSRAVLGATASPDDLAALFRRVSADWPNALTPLTGWPTDLQEDYLQDPLGTYRRADDAQRTILQRLFTAQVQLKQLTAAVAADGKNAEEIAVQIERLVPERRSLAEQFRDQGLRYRQLQVASASKAEAMQLAESFRQRKRDDLAVETLRKWMSARAQQIGESGGAPEYLALADDYWTLLKDEKSTVAMLETARRREPESEDVQDRYRELGYEWTGNRWARPAAPNSNAENSTAPAAPSAKTLGVGLTADEVRQIQGGPTRVATLISVGGVDEFWTYGEGGGSRLVIQFARRASQRESRVVKIYQR